MNLFYLNENLKDEDKLKIIKDFVDAEVSMMEYEGDDHPSVTCHRHLITLVVREELVEKLLEVIYEIDYNSFYNEESNSYSYDLYTTIINKIDV